MTSHGKTVKNAGLMFDFMEFAVEPKLHRWPCALHTCFGDNLLSSCGNISFMP